MDTTREMLTEEIIENARRDRKRLEMVADALTKRYNFGDLKEIEELETVDSQLDPEVAAAFAEEIAKIGDSLTRVNQQLVELVKVETRRTPSDDQPTKLTSRQKEDVFDEIQPQETN
jgi:predicted lipid-binding transport protein (Tim44 family)